jgi:colanic acid/amylovoran biosynthesis glycosyltransferase
MAEIPERERAFLFTRFPVRTETFLSREAGSLRELDSSVGLYSLWPGDGGDASNEATGFGPLGLLKLLFWIPYWAFVEPRVMGELATLWTRSDYRSGINFWENGLGIGFALVHARSFSGRVSHVHAVWASAPAMAALALKKLTGIPYSMAGHAYDLFEHGGDALLKEKIAETTFVRSSTEIGRQRWIQLGAPDKSAHCIRRGLPDTQIPPAAEVGSSFADLPGVRPWRFLAVGRLVEKMGMDAVLELWAALRNRGVPFTAQLIGGGRDGYRLERLRRRLDLEEQVQLRGALSFDEVTTAYAQHDFFFFHGRVAQSGDRAGFPNAIGEAMAWGLPVWATPVGAVPEGIRDGETGWVLSGRPQVDAARTVKLLQDPQKLHRVQASARQWVETHFRVRPNMEALLTLIRRVDC